MTENLFKNEKSPFFHVAFLSLCNSIKHTLTKYLMFIFQARLMSMYNYRISSLVLCVIRSYIILHVDNTLPLLSRSLAMHTSIITICCSNFIFHSMASKSLPYFIHACHNYNINIII